MICGDANYCSHYEMTFSEARLKRLNECPHFDFNPMDALLINEKGYIPKPSKDPNDKKDQLTLEVRN